MKNVTFIFRYFHHRKKREFALVSDNRINHGQFTWYSIRCRPQHSFYLSVVVVGHHEQKQNCFFFPLSFEILLTIWICTSNSKMPPTHNKYFCAAIAAAIAAASAIMQWNECGTTEGNFYLKKIVIEMKNFGQHWSVQIHVNWAICRRMHQIFM